MKRGVALAGLLLVSTTSAAHACNACVTTVSELPSGVLLAIVAALLSGLLVWPGRGRAFVGLAGFLTFFGGGEVQKFYLFYALCITIVQVLFTLCDTEPHGRLIRRAVAVVTVLGFLVLCVVPRGHFSSHTCRSNLTNLGVALEYYAKAHGGRYPQTLDGPVPRYISMLPRCYTGGLSSEREAWLSEQQGLRFGDYGYEVSPTCDAYTLSCGGRNHLYRLFYTSREGIVDQPLR